MSTTNASADCVDRGRRRHVGHLQQNGSDHSSSSARSSISSRGVTSVCKFFIKYKCFVIPIGLFFLVHLVLAVCLTFVHYSSTITDRHHQDRVQEPTLVDRILSPGSDRYTVPDWSAIGLDTPPACNITSKDAISAIQRAKSLQCKTQLAKTACEFVNGLLYPRRLNRQCWNNVTTYGHYVGCFRDEKKNRLLPDLSYVFKDNNSPLNCVEVCLQSGFQYAGVQYGTECFCGNSKPSSSSQLVASEECNMKCPETNEGLSKNESEDGQQFFRSDFCGGYFAIDVFETGVFNGQKGKSTSSAIVGLEDYKNDANHAPFVRIVFFLTLNGRALRQVIRLIKALFHERHYFYIHVDSRQDYLYRQLLSVAYQLPRNVKLVSSRRGTIWGGASLLTVLLDGMKVLVENRDEWGWDWDYIVNLSESDFPLKSTRQLEYFLTQNEGKNFLKSHGRDVQKFIQKQGLDRTFDECEYRMWRLGDRTLPKGIMIDGGSDWIALHRNFVHYAVTSNDELVTGLKKVFRYTLLPAETFFHTLLRNSDFCNSFVDNNLHVTNWKRKLGCKCQYRNVVDWCGCSPNDFRTSDWSRLQLTSSRLLFFGRKFEAIINQEILNKMESWLYPERVYAYLPTLNQFWSSLYHHQDLLPNTGADDALVTLGRSLSRLAFKNVAEKAGIEIEEGLLEFGELNFFEMTAYNQNDELEGILVKTRGENGNVTIEAWFKQRDTRVALAATNYRSAKYQQLLKDFQVGGEYEQKEQIFRNFAGVLGPFSEPTLAFSVVDTFSSTSSFNITLSWIDPDNVIRATSNATISDSSVRNFVKPTIKTPLTPGNWTIKISTTAQGDNLFRLYFVVLPLDVYSGKTFSIEDTHNLPQGLEASQDDQLRLKIDNLVMMQYDFQDFCVVPEKDIVDGDPTIKKSNQSSNNGQNVYKKVKSLSSSCSHTQWSSLYPDPKSTISGIDPDTGFLLP